MGTLINRLSQVLFLALGTCCVPFMAIAETATYAYDNLNRLTRVQYPDGSVVEYTYDPAGNRLTRTVSKQPIIPSPSANQAPTANAGPDQSTNVGTPVMLNGSGTDPDNGPSPLSYAWTQTTGTVVTLARSDTATPSFTPTKEGDLVFSLVVNDGKDTSPADTVTVLVRPAKTPLIVDAGPDQSVKPGVKVVLHGKSSTKPDNGSLPLIYQWSQIDGPTVNLNSSTSANPDFTPNIPGTYIFSLTVSDGVAISQADTVSVTVKDVPVRVLEPNGGEKWKIKSVQTIRWYASNSLANFKKPLTIKFSKDSGKTWSVLMKANVSSGFSQWTPKAAQKSSHARVKICLMDTTKNQKTVCDASDKDFVIQK